MAPKPEIFAECDRAVTWLEGVPPILRDEPDLQAAYYCMAMETDRMEARLEDIRAQLLPSTATVNLPGWEALLRLPGTGPDEARQAALRLRMAGLAADPSGLNWIDRAQARLGPGVVWTYEEHIPGDGSTPAAQTLRISLPYGGASAEMAAAKQIFREETPAELDLIFVSSDGFLLDSSEMDDDAFGI